MFHVNVKMAFMMTILTLIAYNVFIPVYIVILKIAVLLVMIILIEIKTVPVKLGTMIKIKVVKNVTTNVLLVIVNMIPVKLVMITEIENKVKIVFVKMDIMIWEILYVNFV
mmetsp:Transcript_10828/g.970  ORF Transcript_10828/g.970 Transcript_10828/m.970 type:complete len:111 (+) Transcript_10828:328-660(+)